MQGKKIVVGWLWILLLVAGSLHGFALEQPALVRLQATLSGDSQEGARNFLAFYDDLIADPSVSDWIKNGLIRQRQRVADSHLPAWGVVYLDVIGRNFLITGANIALFSDFAQVEHLSGNQTRTLGEAYVIYRDRQADLAVYLLSDEARPVTQQLRLSERPLNPSELLYAYEQGRNAPSSVILRQDERGTWRISDGLFQTKQYSYGSPILNNDGEIVGLVGKENAIIPVTEIQRAIVQAERLRPRATQGALERASQELVNAVMGEEYDAFSTFFSTNLTSSLGIPLFLELMTRVNIATRNTYIMALRDEDPTLLINTVLGIFIMERFNEFDQPIFEQLRVGNAPRNAFQVNTNITYNLNQKPYTIGWIYSAGRWRVANVDSFNFIEKRSVFRQIDRSGAVIGLGYTFMPKIHDLKNMHASLGYYQQVHRLFGVSGELAYHSMSYRTRTINERVQMMHVLGKAQFQLGLAFDSLNFLAYGGLSVGIGVRLSGALQEELFAESLVNRARVVLNGGWFAGLEVGFSDNSPIFVGIEGGAMSDFFTGKYLDIHYGGKSWANAHYLKGYIKFKF
ncbi:trypsin-like peptidase domain-containing protein [Entomospira culicis]|uniref:Trypsin-like peptidase domain-containing protein n=1 Tax=Entomospira culicis TaxID=2719989 RepID=A0A968KUL5_9SPIO|nr:trypsin-like peptidase domain-containing protein [Entomospira culicis]NIZ19401.1 trypsin-like peptidase domain-containing protein [Entomospira culicis]NIZ69694.1 trypsin-like peptidase domain-containing protein [Entomospira culicis]WDI36804.1 hypothetical protein PVA46_05620 [Entomospira culicis]WDI38433.1 hypothetical protein PVA47_05630 [Entomospira culicis]